ncbi:LysE family translocator [Streptomyces sp. DSM 44915]|uniref:LysE family translocator n=1 Tax=Streptomyces chisholmiae TaxID=3075540 RepID=A0ABU2JXN7_9ACTN|nr:LysE family translocator [Streptomyces sp. DSM 44915]MDT0269760.1 LysE family translocator [Streptomyces sp. DSM 44915]
MTAQAAAGGFAVAVLPLVVTPGASLALLFRHVAEAGRRGAVPVVLGTVAGLGVHAAVATAGLSALVASSSQAFTAVRLVGAAYLIALACWTWRSVSPRAGRRPVARSPRRRLAGSAWLQALWGTVLNPKAMAVYLTLAPQFLERGRPLGGQLALLAGVHALLVAAWLLLWTVLLTAAGRLFARPGVRVAIARSSAVVLFALGIRSAASA